MYFNVELPIGYILGLIKSAELVSSFPHDNCSYSGIGFFRKWDRLNYFLTTVVRSKAYLLKV